MTTHTYMLTHVQYTSYTPHSKAILRVVRGSNCILKAEKSAQAKKHCNREGIYSSEMLVVSTNISVKLSLAQLFMLKSTINNWFYKF